MAYPNTLLKSIAKYCEKHKISKSKFGQIMVNDRMLVFDIERKGRELRRSTEADILEKMKSPPPQEAAA